MKKSVLLAGATLLCALPFGLLLPGCGGGDGGGLLNPTPTPSQTFTSTIELSSSQSGVLTTTILGTKLSGNLVIPATSTSQEFSAGTYPFSGTFGAPTTFSATGTIPSGAGTFSISGHIPTESANGNFSLTFAGQTISGAIVPIGTTNTRTPAPPLTATPIAIPRTATPIPIPTGNAGRTNLTVQAAGGADFGTSTFNTSNVSVTGKQQNGNGFSLSATDAGGRTLVFQTRSLGWPNQFRLLQDQTFEFSGFNDSFKLQSGTKAWVAGFISGSSGGTLKVASINGETVTLQAQNLNLGTSSFGLPTGAKGSLTVNGTIVVKIPVS